MPDRRPAAQETDKGEETGSDGARALALMFDLGLRLAVPIVIGVAAGAFLDGSLGTAPWLLLIGILAGVGIAFYAMYDVARSFGTRKR